MSETAEDVLRSCPPEVDAEGIRRQWARLEGDYDVGTWRLPLPPWAERSYENTGDEAWAILCRDLRRAETAIPLCVYLHVPFCTSKCGFCDSYSFKVGSRRAEVGGAYVDRLCEEIRRWSGEGGLSRRPVRTIHLGGGTPTFLPAGDLARLVACCRDVFRVHPTTEWALESTVEGLSEEKTGVLHDLGFRRLHVGVQSLEDPVRAAIGRRHTAAEALAAMGRALALRWVVSADMMCGLPGQTTAGFLAGLDELTRLGVDGVSLYELMIFRQNRRWSERQGLQHRDRTRNFLQFLAGGEFLERRGLIKNLFNHWAGRRDENLYFTFPGRGEDLLALGAIADGVFGDYHYRHAAYPEYLRSFRRPEHPGLLGGLRRNPRENHVRRWTTAVLSGFVPPALVPALAASPELAGESLCARWLARGLVRPEDGGGLRLTGSGSWFAGNLVAELNASLGAGQG